MGILRRLQPFWADLELATPEMDKKASQRAHEQLLAALPRKIEYLLDVLRSERLRVEGSPAERYAAVACWLAKNARYGRPTREMRAAFAHQMAGVDPRILAATRQDFLDLPTMSMCLYVGYYMTEMMREAAPELQYGVFRHKQFLSHNQTVLLGKAPPMHLEPVNVTRCTCGQHLDRIRRATPEDLRSFFEHWKEILLREPEPRKA